MKRLLDSPHVMRMGVLTFFVYLPLMTPLGFQESFLIPLVLLIPFVTLLGVYYKRVYLLFIGVTALFMGVYIHLCAHWGAMQIRSRLEAMIESPLYEAKEYLITHLGLIDGMMAVYGVGLYIMARWAMDERKPFVRGRKRVAPLVMVATFAHIALTQLPPYHIVNEYIEASHRLDKVSTRLFSQGCEDLSGNFQETLMGYDTVLVIIGESASRRHMSLYGYERETTPFLSSLSPLTFEAIAPINQTRYAVPMELSAASVENYDKFFTSPSLVGIFKDLGYHTAWVSNQGKRGIHDSSISSIAKEAHEAFFLNDSYIKATLDTKIVDLLQKRVTPTSPQKEAYFIHLIGSHDNYNRRYTKEFAKFGEKKMVDKYDNSIFFTDHVLSQIYALFKKREKLLVVYFSDHAEAVSEKRSGHGFDPAYKDEYEAPVMFYSSIPNPHLDALKEHLSGKVVNLESLDDMVKIAMGVSTNLQKVSTSKTVCVLSPDRQLLVDDLSFVENKR